MKGRPTVKTYTRDSVLLLQTRICKVGAGQGSGNLRVVAQTSLNKTLRVMGFVQLRIL